MPTDSMPDDERKAAADDAMSLIVASAAGNTEWVGEAIDRICDRGDRAIYTTIVGLVAVLASRVVPDFDAKRRTPGDFYALEVVDIASDQVVEPETLTVEHRVDLVVPRMITAYCNDDMSALFALIDASFDADRIDFFLQLIKLAGVVAAHTARDNFQGRIALGCKLCECPEDPDTLPTGGFTEGPPGPFGPATYTPHHSWCTQRKALSDG